MNENTWDYYPINGKTEYQEDWNQTLLSKFNQIYATNRYLFMRDNNMVIVLASSKLKKLIETLLYYNVDTNCLANKYVIHFFEPNKPFEMSDSFEEDNEEYQMKLNSFYFILEDKKPINLQILNLIY